jgi:uncharacterized protein (DUF2236 family)
MSLVARLFGTPATVIPPTLNDLRDYFDHQLASETITVTEPAKEIAAVILQAPLPNPLRLFAPTHRLATNAQLPPRLRHEYGLRWTVPHALLLPGAAAALKYTSWPVLQAAKRVRVLGRPLAV